MTKQDYQNEIISLLNNLAQEFHKINLILNDIYMKHCFQEGLSEIFYENDKQQLQNDLIERINRSWTFVDKIIKSVNMDIQFINVDIVSKSIIRLVKECKETNSTYIDLEEEGFLTESLIKSKEALLDNLEKLSKYIEIYNKKFNPKLISLKAAFNLVNTKNKNALKSLYEEVFCK